MAEEYEDQPLLAGRAEGSIAYKLRLAQIAAWRAFEARVTGYGVAPRYLGLLMIIEANPGQPQSRLAEAVAIQRSSLVAILDQLEREGIVERRPSPRDRRSKSVRLTERGAAMLADLAAEADAHEAALTEGLSEAERATMAAALDRIVLNMRGPDSAAPPAQAADRAAFARRS